jgi:hypothetical protein
MEKSHRNENRMGERMKTCQSELTFENNKVKKVYDKKFKFYDQKNFNSERRVTSLFQGKYCVKMWDFTNDGYTMERLDFDLGDDRNINPEHVKRIFFSIGLEGVLNMLDDMLGHLQAKGINHRDINPGNILWDEKNQILKFTDFFWSQHVDHPVDIPGAVNQIYKDDEHAILKIKNEITAEHKQLEPELEGIYLEFQDKVAKDVHVVGKGRDGKTVGPYCDGSSIRRGWAYHVVDLPYFRKIEAHKDTCRDEYRMIKANLPLTPGSVLDIGCSVGYQIFNFTRGFDLVKAKGYENDPAVLNFLRSVKAVYNLNEVDFDQTFSDQTELENYDVAVWLNSHMWVYKQLGKERTLQAVRNVLDHCKVLFFQTAGDYSSSIYKVTEYKNAEDVKQMLYSAGATTATPLKSFIGMHGAPRDMFMVSK